MWFERRHRLDRFRVRLWPRRDSSLWIWPLGRWQLVGWRTEGWAINGLAFGAWATITGLVGLVLEAVL